MWFLSWVELPPYFLHGAHPPCGRSSFRRAVCRWAFSCCFSLYHLLPVLFSNQMSSAHLPGSSHLFLSFSSRSSMSLCAAINLLGLTWQLKPSDGPLLNNGLGAGLPVNSDVATLPSGGRGMNYQLHAPHQGGTQSALKKIKNGEIILDYSNPLFCSSSMLHISNLIDALLSCYELESFPNTTCHSGTLHYSERFTSKLKILFWLIC